MHRQLTLLDAMERRETDTDELEDLFRVDHLATRMRRNAENLIVLSGATAGRGWRRPVPMVDVVRGRGGRGRGLHPGDGAADRRGRAAGRAVGDVIHLLAELIENAVSFSPPYTVAQVGGHMVANGYAIEIEDRGLGMSRREPRPGQRADRRPAGVQPVQLGPARACTWSAGSPSATRSR